MQGYEYGTTTGRPRRTGWFDAVAAKYAVMINGLSSVVVTKLDVLSNLKKVKICVAYDVEGNNISYNIPAGSLLRSGLTIPNNKDSSSLMCSSRKVK